MKAPGAIVSGIGGFAADVYRMATCQLTNPHSYLKFLTINRVRKETGSTTFVETGTYLGATAYRCSSVFDAVYTIELNHELAQRAKDYLSRRKNVEVIQGDALVQLENLFVNRTLARAVVFLDGHFSGGDTSCGQLPEPAIAELEILARHSHLINGIVIDDFRNFGVEPGYPLKSELLNAIETCFPSPSFRVHVQNDMVTVIRRCVS